MIFLIGPHGAGKTTIAEIITCYNFIYFDLGKILRDYHKRKKPEIDFRSWCMENERIHGPLFTDKIIIREIKRRYREMINKVCQPQDLVIVGSRSFQGIKYIINEMSSFNEHENVIICIEAPFDVLKERYCAREKRKLSDQEFQAILNKDKQMGLLEAEDRADLRISNVVSMQELKERVKDLIDGELGYSIM